MINRAAVSRALACRKRSAVVLGILLGAVGVAYSVNLASYPGRVDDEGTYVAQAWAVVHLHALSHYTYTYDHPPLGWLLLAVWTWVVAPVTAAGHAITTGRAAMVVVQLASCALLFALVRRLGVRRSLAALAVVLFAFSPLAIAYHRMVYLDNLAVPSVFGAFTLALSPQRRLVAYAGSAACFAAAVLTKETTLLLLPALGYQLWQRTEPHHRDFPFAVFSIVLIIGLGGYPLYALLKNELFPGTGHVSLLGGLAFQLTRPGTGEVLCSATVGHAIVAQWLSLDHWLLIAGMVATVFAFVVPRYRPLAVGAATLGVVLLRPGYLPIPYVIGLVALAPVMVAVASETVWRWCTTAAGAHSTRRGLGGRIPSSPWRWPCWPPRSSSRAGTAATGRRW